MDKLTLRRTIQFTVTVHEDVLESEVQDKFYQGVDVLGKIKFSSKENPNVSGHFSNVEGELVNCELLIPSQMIQSVDEGDVKENVEEDVEKPSAKPTPVKVERNLKLFDIYNEKTEEYMMVADYSMEEVIKNYIKDLPIEDFEINEYDEADLDSYYIETENGNVLLKDLLKEGKGVKSFYKTNE